MRPLRMQGVCQRWLKLRSHGWKIIALDVSIYLSSYGKLKTNTVWVWPGDYNLRNGTGVEMCHCQWWLKACSYRVEKWRQTIAVFDPRWGQALYKLLISTCAMYCKKKKSSDYFHGSLTNIDCIVTKFLSLRLLTMMLLFFLQFHGIVFRQHDSTAILTTHQSPHSSTRPQLCMQAGRVVAARPAAALTAWFVAGQCGCPPAAASFLRALRQPALRRD